MTLPILLSIPHGGTECPAEIRDRVCITPMDLWDDIDPCSRDIYDVAAAVAYIVSTPIARSFVDMNRAPADRPPANPDGVVKTATCHNRPIYHDGRELTGALADRLVARYHAPYHDRLTDLANAGGARVALDCHTMARFPPAVAPDAKRERPLFCLSNGDGATCSAALLDNVGRAFAKAFECDADTIRFNRPFRGGYITRHHGMSPLPWIQIEMNRKWYLDDPWFDRASLKVDPARLRELQARFLAALSLIDIE